MSDPTIIIAIAAGCGGLLIVVSIVFAVRLCRKSPLRPSVNILKEARKAALSLGGNLVYEYTTPIEEKYRLVTHQRLGSGSSAEVVVGENLITKRKYAIKIVQLNRKEVAWRYEREKNFLKDIDHTNVVRLYEVCSRPTALYFVMELCTGGHLGQVLRSTQHGRLTEDRAREYVQQLTRAIAHCHYHGISHRDVKLQNILLESNNHKEAQIKLVDFGNGARYRGHLPMRKIVGTTYTAAPEVFREFYDERCDVWSMGVVSYILLSGRRPFEKMKLPPNSEHLLQLPANSHLPADSRDDSVVTSILLGKYDFNFPVWDEISTEAMNFVRYCLVMDFNKRNTASEMLEHPWLTYSDEEFPTIGARGLSRISQGSAAALKKTLKREATSGSQLASMRHTSMLAVAFNLTTTKTQQLRTLFQEMDQDGSGSIDRDEFLTAVQAVNPDMSTEYAYELFDRLDQDWNRCISFIEFLAAMVDPDDVDMQDMNQAFQLLDTDQKGYITREDLMRVLSTSTAEEIILNSDQTMQQNTRSSHSTSPNSADLLNSSPVRIARSISESGKKLMGASGSKTPIGSAADSRQHFFPAPGAETASAIASNLTTGAGAGALSARRSSGERTPFAQSGAVPIGASISSPGFPSIGTVGSNSSATAGSSTREQVRSKAAADRTRKLHERIQEIMDKADVNKDGVVSYTEFLFAMADGTMTDSRSRHDTRGRVQSRDEGLHKMVGGGARLGGSNSSRDLHSVRQTHKNNTNSNSSGNAASATAAAGATGGGEVYETLAKATSIVKSAHSQPNVHAPPSPLALVAQKNVDRTGRRSSDGAVTLPSSAPHRRLSDPVLLGRSSRNRELSPRELNNSGGSSSGDHAFHSGEVAVGAVGGATASSRPRGLSRNPSARLSSTALDSIDEKVSPTSLFGWFFGSGKNRSGNRRLPPKMPAATAATSAAAAARYTAGTSSQLGALFDNARDIESGHEESSSRSDVDSSRVPTFFQQSHSTGSHKGPFGEQQGSGRFNNSMDSNDFIVPRGANASTKRYTIASSSGAEVRRNSAVALVRNIIGFGGQSSRVAVVDNESFAVVAAAELAKESNPALTSAIFSEDDMVMNDTDEGLLASNASEPAADYSSVLPDDIVISGHMSSNQRRDGGGHTIHPQDGSSGGPAVSGDNSVASYEGRDILGAIEAQHERDDVNGTVAATELRSNSYDSNDDGGSHPSYCGSELDHIHDLVNEEVFTLSGTHRR